MTLLTGALAAAFGTLAQDKATDQTEAKKTFEALCAPCHGLDARGGERGPDLVSRADVVRKNDSELKEILEKGKSAAGMPSFAGYGPVRISALVNYLRTLQGRGKSAQLPGSSAQGKSLFFGKARCSDCHMAGGQGGIFGPDLSKYGTKRSVDDIRAAIVNTKNDLDPRRGLVTVVLTEARRLSGLARNEDNFSLQLQTADGTFYLLNKKEIQKLTYEGKSPMPSDYGSVLTAAEMNDLVSFLIRSAENGTGTTVKDANDDFDE